jgi:hypothetical protein
MRQFIFHFQQYEALNFSLFVSIFRDDLFVENMDFVFCLLNASERNAMGKKYIKISNIG